MAAARGPQTRRCRSNCGTWVLASVAASAAVVAVLSSASPSSAFAAASVQEHGFARRGAAFGAARSSPAQSHRSSSIATAARGGEELTGKSAYVVGITWYLMHFVVGISNDGLMKFLGATLPPFQIVFMRFLSAAAVLLPVGVFQGRKAFQTEKMWMHGLRGVLLALGIGLWCKGLSMMPFASCIVINNTMPFFKMTFAMLILGEKVGKERWLASLGGFLGCLIVFNPTAATFQPQSLVLLLSAMCFAMLDVLNKKYAVSESIIAMLFYGSIATAVVSAFRAYQTWVPLTAQQLGLFAVLGCGANLLLFCLLRAFRYVDASATCPYRYTEFVLSAIAGFVIFREKPTLATLLGSCIILPSVVYCAMCETREASKEDNKEIESKDEA